MGNMRQFLESGGFSQYLYRDNTDFDSVTINGIVAKVVYKVNDPTKSQAGLPSYSNTSDMYFKKGPDGDIIQAKFYEGRKMKMDFDWGHDHENADGTLFHKGVVHMQVYTDIVGDKIPRLSGSARLMTDAEIKKFGPVILHYNPNVRFR